MGRVILDFTISCKVVDCDTIIINRGNSTGVVLISLDEYNSLKETEYIMSSAKVMEEIRQGERDLAEGKGIEVDLANL